MKRVNIGQYKKKEEANLIPWTVRLQNTKEKKIVTLCCNK